MNNVKMCIRCNAAVISNLNSDTADYYRHLRVKYCDACRQIVKREQTARRVKALKERKKAEYKATQTRLELLEKENAVLRQNIEDYEVLAQFLDYMRKERAHD